MQQRSKLENDMRIAFDCKGTLMNGPAKVKALFDYFLSKGCKITIWSNSYSYAEETRDGIGNDSVDCITKLTKWNLESCVNPMDEYFDIAVDDDSEQTYLAAKAFIWVNTIPDDTSRFEETYGYMFKAKS